MINTGLECLFPETGAKIALTGGRRITQRRGQAAGAFDRYFRLNYKLTNNPGGGDCLYYSIVDGVRLATRENTMLSQQEYFGLAHDIRKAAAALAKKREEEGAAA